VLQRYGMYRPGLCVGLYVGFPVPHSAVPAGTILVSVMKIKKVQVPTTVVKLPGTSSSTARDGEQKQKQKRAMLNF
jgi:hypothetical protein